MESRNKTPTDNEVREHIENLRSRGNRGLADLIEMHAFKAQPEKRPDCPLCKDSGYTEWTQEIGGVIYEYAEECICMKQRREMQRLETSNLPDPTRMSLGQFRTDQDWQIRILDTAYRFAGWSPKAADEIPPWFFVGGHPGTGKTHVCTGICCNLIGQGRQVLYRIWNDVAEEMKDKRNTTAYRQTMKRLQEVDVLYLDDFLHGSPSKASLELAWEIVNGRYTNRKQTIFSSEHFIQEIIDKDHGLGGRIHERARGFVLGIARDATRDYRTKGEMA